MSLVYYCSLIDFLHQLHYYYIYKRKGTKCYCSQIFEINVNYINVLKLFIPIDYIDIPTDTVNIYFVTIKLFLIGSTFIFR